MRAKCLPGVTAAMVAAMLLTGSIEAGAQAAKEKKVSLSQAWDICLKWLNQDTPATAENQQQRYYRGAACLAKYGYDFKSAGR